MNRRVVAICLLAFVWPLVGSADAARELPNLFGGPFELIDQQGQTRWDTDFRGRFMLIYFGYTFCPDICPTHLQNMSEALDEIGPLAAKLAPIFVTVDPARDNVDTLKGYVAAFHPQLIGLTGSEAQIRKIALAYRLHRVKVVGESSDDYLVSHATTMFLMGPDGKFVTLFPHNTPVDAIAKTLRKYLS